MSRNYALRTYITYTVGMLMGLAKDKQNQLSVDKTFARQGFFQLSPLGKHGVLIELFIVCASDAAGLSIDRVR